MGNALNCILKQQPDTDDVRRRRVKEIKDEGWDLFLRVLADGSLVVTAVAVSYTIIPRIQFDQSNF